MTLSLFILRKEDGTDKGPWKVRVVLPGCSSPVGKTRNQSLLGQARKVWEEKEAFRAGRRSLAAGGGAGPGLGLGLNPHCPYLDV